MLLNARLTLWSASIGAALLIAGVMGSQLAFAQVNKTLHNLGTSPRAPSESSSSVCVFCHTPRGANGTATSPLWNRTQTASSLYTTYNSLGSSSLDGATAPVGSVSISCLSCHDGVQATNTMINESSNTGGGAQASTSAPRVTVKPSSAAAIGGEARADHPFGIRYAGGAVSPAGPPAAPAGYPNKLMRNTEFNSAQSALLNEQSIWWIETAGGVTGGRDKSDIQLYTRSAMLDDGSVANPEPFVECASCHDPHSAVNGIFLRITNDGSAVCLSCHNQK